MLRAGAIVLTVWSGFNVVLAASILTALTVFRKHAPILFIVFAEAEVPALDARFLAASRALALLFNASTAAMSALALCVIWCALAKGQPWAFWALLVCGAFVQAMGFVADAAIGTKTLAPNLVLTALFVAGIALTGFGIFLR